jgi:hypothetical protein
VAKQLLRMKRAVLSAMLVVIQSAEHKHTSKAR